MEIEAIFSFANQYQACAIDGVPIEIAEKIDREYDYNYRGNRLVGLRFYQGKLVNRMVSQRYKKSAEWRCELDAIAEYDDVIEWIPQQPEDISPAALEVVL